MLEIAQRAAAPSARATTLHSNGPTLNGEALPTLSREELRHLIAEMID